MNDLRCIRRWIAFFMAALIMSGLTAVPLEWLQVVQLLIGIAMQQR